MVFIGSRGLTTHVEISTCVKEDIIFYRQMCSICKVSLTITVCQVGLNTKCYLSKTTWEGIRVAVEELLLNSPPDEIFALLNKCRNCIGYARGEYIALYSIMLPTGVAFCLRLVPVPEALDRFPLPEEEEMKVHNSI